MILLSMCHRNFTLPVSMVCTVANSMKAMSNGAQCYGLVETVEVLFIETSSNSLTIQPFNRVYSQVVRHGTATP